MSESEKYSQNLSALIGDHAPDVVTEAMNALVDLTADGTDLFSVRAARQVLAATEW